MKKISDAMLEGFRRVGGSQIKGRHFQGSPVAPVAVCASGAVLLGTFGCAEPDTTDAHYELLPTFVHFQHEYGITISDLNDAGVPWEDIYGMAVAAGI